MRKKTKILAVLPIAIVAPLWMSPAHATSFDCTQADGPEDILICQDFELGKLDDQIAQTYADVKAAIPKKFLASFESRYNRQVKKRYDCGFDAQCIKWSYLNLQQWLCSQTPSIEACKDGSS